MTSPLPTVGEEASLDDCASQRISQVSMETTSGEASLGERLTLLEEENASCNYLQQKVDQQYSAASSTIDTEEANSSKASCPQCKKLSEELRISKDRCNEVQHLHLLSDKKVKTLQTQVDSFQTQEDSLRNEIVSLEQKLRETVSAGERLSTGHMLLRETDVPQVDSAVVEKSTSVLPTEISSQEPQYRKKMEDLERENNALKEQCQTAEMKMNTLRMNIRKVSANWFERKTQTGDSESCVHQDHFLRKENIPRLLAEISFATGKLELTEKIYSELKVRVKDYENVIEDQEVIIHGLKDQLDVYFEDNQKMFQQLSAFTKIFEDLVLTEKTQVSSVEPPDFSLFFNTLPSEQDFTTVSDSINKTYIKLEELILEKKSLATEMDRLKELNAELQRRLTQQETRLVSVSDALHNIWMLVSDMREQHARIHSSESILRYELREKRKLLCRLREELESSREKWVKIREMNSQSEEAWSTLRAELDERRSHEPIQEVLHEAPRASGTEFEPPVDLLLDIDMEYRAMDANDDPSTAIVAAIQGQDVRADRLRDLERECTRLYQKLMASTAKSLALASRLTALHDHYGSEDDYGDSDGSNDSQVLSPDSPANFERSDTAHISDIRSVASEVVTNETLTEDLSNFLPRKIEILYQGNQSLEAQHDLLLRERNNLKEALEGESNKQTKNKHLGKCVDELGRNSKVKASNVV